MIYIHIYMAVIQYSARIYSIAIGQVLKKGKGMFSNKDDLQPPPPPNHRDIVISGQYSQFLLFQQ